MSDFEAAKMHQIRFPLEFRPHTHSCGSLQRSPNLLAVFGDYFYGEGEEEKWKEEGEERKGKDRRMRKRRRWKKEEGVRKIVKHRARKAASPPIWVSSRDQWHIAGIYGRGLEPEIQTRHCVLQ